MQQQSSTLREQGEINQATIEQTRNDLHQQELKNTGLQTRIDEINLANSRHEQQRHETNSVLKLEFGKLASELLDEKNRKLAEQNQSLLQPLREQLLQFRSRVDEIHTNETKQQASLQTELLELRKLNHRITEEASSLTKALQGRGSSQAQGAWGEMILERLLEESGLVKGREYEVQKSLLNDDEKRQRPDVIVHLPDKKDVIIDAKVSLNAYSRYHSAESDADRVEAITDLKTSIRNHINDLSQRNYFDLLDGRSLDLVLMFVPIEGAYILALEKDPHLFEYAFGKRIALVGPSTLPGTLKIINYLWRTDDQNRNASEIAKRAGNLYDKLYGMIEDLDKLETNLQRSQTSLAGVKNKLSQGKGNVLGQVERFRKLGVSVKKPIKHERDYFDDDLESTNQLKSTVSNNIASNNQVKPT